jgi:hypothetical protein
MKEIELSQGKTALVDDDLFDELNKHKWHYALGYARRNVRLENGKRKIVFMHRVIADTQEGYETDHINGDTLDNRRYNLRNCTKSQNQWNINKGRGKSKYRGVHFHKTKRHKTGYWVARINVNGKRISIGYFKTEKEAALSYNEAAIKYHGEYAKLNEVV